MQFSLFTSVLCFRFSFYVFSGEEILIAIMLLCHI
jgi:hypothetical protein